MADKPDVFFSLKAGQTAPSFKVQLLQEDQYKQMQPFDATGYEAVVFTMKRGEREVTGDMLPIGDPVQGKFLYVWTDDDVTFEDAEIGEYQADVAVRMPGERYWFFPSDGYMRIDVLPPISDVPVPDP